MRVDLNLPIKDGQILDTTRIERILPTLQELADKKAKIILLSHFGRPKGRIEPTMSLKAIVEAMNAFIPVGFVEDCIGAQVENSIKALQPGQILLLENVRFYAQEEENEEEFARQLASLGDFYVNDAFSASHRAHASVEAITHFLPGVAGRLMEAELAALEHALRSPKRPVAAIVSGSKVSTKLELLSSLVERVDYLILGGGLANTFLLAQGYSIGQSLCEPTMIETAQRILAAAEKVGCRLVLPQDVMVTENIQAGAPAECKAVDAIENSHKIADIGQESIQTLSQILASCATVVWNGPLGVFECPPFDRGTREIATVIASLTQERNIFSVAGGGETVAALTQTGQANRLSYLSTAGGAFLEWLEGKTLPGIAALNRLPH